MSSDRKAKDGGGLEPKSCELQFLSSLLLYGSFRARHAHNKGQCTSTQVTMTSDISPSEYWIYIYKIYRYIFFFSFTHKI